MQRGDTLYTIAAKYNTTVNDIKSLNNLSSNILNIGQVLRIPGEEVIDIETEETVPTNNYVVQYGDTINSIATSNNIDVNELINLNNLTDMELYIGQILKLPTLAGEDIIGENEYVVKRGDSLYSIARTFNTTVDNLKRLNNLTSNTLQIGDVLKISSTPSSTSGNTYIVKRGDSLYSIARTYNTTVAELKTLNNLTSNLLSIGQVLKLSV